MQFSEWGWGDPTVGLRPAGYPGYPDTRPTRVPGYFREVRPEPGSGILRAGHARRVDGYLSNGPQPYPTDSYLLLCLLVFALFFPSRPAHVVWVVFSFRGMMYARGQQEYIFPDIFITFFLEDKGYGTPTVDNHVFAPSLLRTSLLWFRNEKLKAVRRRLSHF